MPVLQKMMTKGAAGRYPALQALGEHERVLPSFPPPSSPKHRAVGPEDPSGRGPTPCALLSTCPDLLARPSALSHPGQSGD